MKPLPTYLFYDLETSGLNPAFDQILQFAAIRTDAAFQELSRHEFRVRLRPDVIPSPGALLATGVTTMQALTTGLYEYDAVREIHALVNQPGTISTGYNSLSFDDKFLRFAFYRNLLPPYTHQWQNGCRRLDLFPITVLYWLANSPLLTWPSLEDKPTLRLEHLSHENSLADGQAHDALVDVTATVELARRLHQDEGRWADCLTLFDKTTFDDRLAHLPHYGERPYALLIHGKFGYDQQCQVPALHLGQSNVAGVAHLWLRLDRPELAQTTPSTIAQTTWVIRQKPGEPPFVHSPHSHKLSEERRDVTGITSPGFGASRNCWPPSATITSAALSTTASPPMPTRPCTTAFYPLPPKARAPGSMRPLWRRRLIRRRSLRMRLSANWRHVC